jgi:lactoylglutathione lyase
VRVNYVIVFVSNMKKSVAFYRDVVGMPLKFESPGWSEFATGGATLALHSSGQAHAEPASRLETPGWCRPGLSVPSLDEFHQRMLTHDVPCLEAPAEVFGVRVAQYADPDGLPFSVGEERRDR